jgi:glucokinase
VASASLAVGVDIGGTKIAVGAVDASGRLDRLTHLATASTSLDELADAVARTVDGRGPHGVGIGICEVVDAEGRIRSHTSIDWTESELAGALGSIVLDADVRAAALAEARLGAGRDFASFVYVTVGTGISHSLVVDGEPHRGAHGCAQLVGSAPLTLTCPHCGERFSLSAEDVASGDAVARGRPLAEAGEMLGSFVALLVNVLDPAAVVVGGGLGTAGGDYWTALERSVRAHVWAEHVRDVPVLQAGLGADSGVIGAGLVALHAAETRR